MIGVWMGPCVWQVEVGVWGWPNWLLGLRSRGKFHTGIWNSGTSSGCMAQLPEPRSEKQKLPKNHRDSDGREGHARAWQGIRMDL